MDNCEFASCCSEFTPPILLDINTFGTQRMGGQSPYIEPSQVFTPIFAPPPKYSLIIIPLHCFRT
jgi:hypothetical protein